jgi:hypothetical protein
MSCGELGDFGWCDGSCRVEPEPHDPEEPSCVMCGFFVSECRCGDFDHFDLGGEG